MKSNLFRLMISPFILCFVFIASGDPARCGTRKADDTTVGFFPVATSLELRKVVGPEGEPVVELTATLDQAGIAQLLAVTGRSDLAQITYGERAVILRDDGRDGDPRAGDGRFTAVTDIDPNDVEARGLLEDRLAAEGRLARVPRFEDRELLGFERRPAFSVSEFNLGFPVSFRPLPVDSARGILTPPPPPTPTPEEFERAVNLSLFISTNPQSTESREVSPVFSDTTRIYRPCARDGNGDGVWSFGHLMRQMAGSNNPEEFTEAWLRLFTEDQTSEATNQFTVEAVSEAQQFIDDWKLAGGGAIDLDAPPFRLLAITPRVDLRSGTANPYGPGQPQDGGELRFIFGAVSPLNPCQVLDFSLIIEYGVPIDTCKELRRWARAWRDLDDLDAWGFDGLEIAEYLQQLEDLTTQVTEAGANPDKPSGSALNQLRTNENDLHANETGSNNWRIREFHLAENGLLEQATTAATPAHLFRNVEPEHEWFDSLILKPSIPAAPRWMRHFETGEEVRFLGAESVVGFPHDDNAWGFVSLLDFSDEGRSDQRHRRSLQTCAGCHGDREVGTPQAHIVHPLNDDNAPFETPEFLAPFLIGSNFPDPESPHTVVDPVAPSGTPGSKTRSFFDLRRRHDDLHVVANQLCLATAVSVEQLMTEHLLGE